MIRWCSHPLGYVKLLKKCWKSLAAVLLSVWQSCLVALRTIHRFFILHEPLKVVAMAGIVHLVSYQFSPLHRRKFRTD